jgi:hypothetical protein
VVRLLAVVCLLAVAEVDCLEEVAAGFRSAEADCREVVAGFHWVEVGCRFAEVEFLEVEVARRLAEVARRSVEAAFPEMAVAAGREAAAVGRRRW